MSNWQFAAEVEDCPAGENLELVIGDRIVALFNVDGEYYALDGVCAHQGGPLGKGCLQGKILTCPWHGWQYDVTDGQHQFSPSVKQPSFPVRVDQQQIFVDVSE